MAAHYETKFNPGVQCTAVSFFALPVHILHMSGSPHVHHLRLCTHLQNTWKPQCPDGSPRSVTGSSLNHALTVYTAHCTNSARFRLRPLTTYGASAQCSGACTESLQYTCTMHRWAHWHRTLHMSSTQAVYTPLALFTTARTNSVQCTCPVSLSVHLQLTLLLHRACLSAVTVYTVRLQFTGEFTYKVNYTCIVLHSYRVCHSCALCRALIYCWVTIALLAHLVRTYFGL